MKLVFQWSDKRFAVSSLIAPGADKMPDGCALLPKNSAEDFKMRMFFRVGRYAAAIGGNPMSGWKGQMQRSWMISDAGTTSSLNPSGSRFRLSV
ncbi:hypothetical protein D3C72_1944120 [compost metagenome]